MATVHYVTRIGLREIAEGRWNTAGATDFRIGLLKGTARPAGIDSQSEVYPLETVADLLAIADVDELTVSGYARMTLDRSNAAIDAGNNRVGLDAGDETLATVAAGESIIGAFVYRHVTDDDDAALWGVLLLDAPGLPTNGSNILTTFADLYRLTAA